MSFLKVNGKIVMSDGIPVKIPDPPIIQDNKNITPSFEEQVIIPDEGNDYMAQVTVHSIPMIYKKSKHQISDGYTVIIGDKEV